MSKCAFAFAFFALCLLFSPLQAQQKRTVAPKKNTVVPKKNAVAPKKNTVAPKKNTVAPKQSVVNPVAKLNNEQKRHLKLYKDISSAVASGKVDRQKIFQLYYELFSSSADELVKANTDKADEMKIRAGEALDSNNEVLSKRCNEAAALYTAMADEVLKLPELYKAGKKAQIDASLKIYLAKETDLIRVGAKPCPRRWLTTKEAEACLVAMNRSQAKTTRQN